MIPKRVRLSLILLTIACAHPTATTRGEEPAPSSSPSSESAAAVSAPRGKPATLDGKLDESEWADANRIPLTPDGEMLVKADDEFVYIGLRSARPALGSIAVCRDEQIFVLHASAALGTAVYEKRGADGWTMKTGFTWALRETGTDEAMQAKRAVHLKRRGWVASTVDMGAPGQMEFQIARSWLGSSPALVNVSFYHPYDGAEPRVAVWPPGANDATRNEALLGGEPPPTLRVETSTWGRIDLP